MKGRIQADSRPLAPRLSGKNPDPYRVAKTQERIRIALDVVRLYKRALTDSQEYQRAVYARSVEAGLMEALKVEQLMARTLAKAGRI